ncbi:Uncharacterised protein [Xylophilus ampelinus]|nr:hypothetical protein [Variovorax sp.]VTY37779.1 Uncharacterised protein [Xylophilus ampelinus]
MPYVEILAPRADSSRKRELAGVVTRGIVDGFGVAPSTVTIYFQPIERADYAHEGELGQPDAGSRVFVKVHAYRRTPDERRAVAEAVTPALAACFDTTGHNVAVYFLDRERDEVAHDGHLASDELAAHPAA